MDTGTLMNGQNADNGNFSFKIFLMSILTVAMPIALQNLLSTTASMVDTVMIGSQGESAVAAVGICSQVTSLFFSSYYGFAGGSILFLSQYWGVKNHKGINRAFGLAASCMLMVSLIFGVTAVCAPQFILGIYTDKASLIEVGLPYMRLVGFSFPFIVLNMILSFLLRSTDRVRIPLVCSIAGLVVNFILNWTLIYGRFGLPKLGVAGAAIGTLCSSIVNFLLLLFFVLRDRETVTLKLSWMFSWKGFVPEFFKKCAPIICNELLYGIGQMFINIVMGHQDESAIAATAAFRVLEGFVFAFFGGLANASSVIVGREVGAGRHMLAYKYVKGFSTLCPLITFAIVGIMFLLNRPLYSLFGLGDEALEYGKYMLLIYLAAGTVRTCNYIQNECYRSGGDPLFGTVLEITCLFTISVPFTWVSGMVFHMPFLAVFAFVYTDELIRLFFEIRHTRSGKWVKPVTDEGKAAVPGFLKSLGRKA